MGLIDALRKAEQQSKGVAQRGFDKARDTWEDAERRIRRKMRIFPNTQRNRVASELPAENVPALPKDRAA